MVLTSLITLKKNNMKKNKKYILGLVVIATLAITLVACEKSFDEKITLNNDNAGNSIVQLYMATVGASRNYVYVDGRPQNGAALSSSSVFPATGFGFMVPSGSRAFLLRDTLSTSTQIPLSFANILDRGKNYTIFAYDTITAVKQKTVITDIVIPTDTTCRVRFAHFAYSPTLMPNIDLYSFKRVGNVISNIAPTDVSSFVPFASALNDTLQVREAGTTNVLAQLNGFLPTAKRSYTLIYRGTHRGATTVRFLSSFVNY
jgi:hypothetical protein